jgi:hypothetical protein
MNATNDTNVDQLATGDFLITYSAIVTMALVPIWVGSFWSLQRKYQLETAGQVRIQSPSKTLGGRKDDKARRVHVPDYWQLCAVWIVHSV